MPNPDQADEDGDGGACDESPDEQPGPETGRVACGIDCACEALGSIGLLLMFAELDP